jgi:MoaA/NifB/PqqE/SkfB family radical SAM enzyme
VYDTRKAINIETSIRCTLECPKCERKYLQSNNLPFLGGDMSVSDFIKVMKYYDSIHFIGNISDPIFAVNLIDFLKLTYENNKRTVLHTAASHKTPTWYMEAFKANANAKWVFGIDGLPKDSHKYRINQDGEHLFDMMKLALNCGLTPVWKYIVFKYNQNDIEEARALAADYNITFKLVMSSRWDESYRYGEWKDEMWDKLLFQPSDEYIGNWLGNDNKQ